MSETVTMPSLIMMTSIVSKESLARDRDTDTLARMHTHACTHIHTHSHTHTHTHMHAASSMLTVCLMTLKTKRMVCFPIGTSKSGTWISGLTMIFHVWMPRFFGLLAFNLMRFHSTEVRAIAFC